MSYGGTQLAEYRSDSLAEGLWEPSAIVLPASPSPQAVRWTFITCRKGALPGPFASLCPESGTAWIDEVQFVPETEVQRTNQTKSTNAEDLD